jgi:hypothetical protein
VPKSSGVSLGFGTTETSTAKVSALIASCKLLLKELIALVL